MTPDGLFPDVPTDVPTWVGAPKHVRWLEGIVRAVLVLNLADALLTLLWVWTGQASEANPLLADVVVRHPVLFVLIKIALVSLGFVLLWRYRHRPFAVVAIFITFLSYYGLLLIHMHQVGRQLQITSLLARLMGH